MHVFHIHSQGVSHRVINILLSCCWVHVSLNIYTFGTECIYPLPFSWKWHLERVEKYVFIPFMKFGIFMSLRLVVQLGPFQKLIMLVKQQR